LGGSGFAFVGEWRKRHRRGARTEIHGIRLNGVDIITCGNDDRPTHFKVMVRRLKAINLLHRLIGKQLAKRYGAGRHSIRPIWTATGNFQGREPDSLTGYLP